MVFSTVSTYTHKHTSIYPQFSCITENVFQKIRKMFIGKTYKSMYLVEKKGIYKKMNTYQRKYAIRIFFSSVNAD